MVKDKESRLLFVIAILGILACILLTAYFQKRNISDFFVEKKYNTKTYIDIRKE
jgi:Tfp pilus assembly protein PilE